MTTPALPPYVYGRETSPNEKVWPESLVRAHGDACATAALEAAAQPQLWRITAVRPLAARERTHTTVQLLVLATSAEQALTRAKDWDNGRTAWFSTPEVASPVQSTTYGSCTPASFAKMRGEEPVPAKAKAAPKPSTRPLGEAQLSVLRSLQEHGQWPGGWVWGTESNTCRILDGLAQRCLVNRVEKDARDWPEFTVSALGLAALSAAKK